MLFPNTTHTTFVPYSGEYTQYTACPVGPNIIRELLVEISHTVVPIWSLLFSFFFFPIVMDEAEDLVVVIVLRDVEFPVSFQYLEFRKKKSLSKSGSLSCFANCKTGEKNPCLFLSSNGFNVGRAQKASEMKFGFFVWLKRGC